MRKRDEQAATHTHRHTYPSPPDAEKFPLKWILTRKEATDKRACTGPARSLPLVTTHGCCPLALQFGTLHPSCPAALPPPAALKWVTGKETALFTNHGTLGKSLGKTKPCLWPECVVCKDSIQHSLYSPPTAKSKAISATYQPPYH